MGVVERRETIVVGGGQAGLSTAYELSRLGIDCLVLEAESRVGDQWRRRWDSLRLFTPARLDRLPGLRFPAADMTYPTKDEMADYLVSYANTLELNLRTGTKVVSLRRAGDAYALETTAGAFMASQVVIATGYQGPKIPALAAELAPKIRQLHAYEYRNPTQLRRDGGGR